MDEWTMNVHRERVNSSFIHENARAQNRETSLNLSFSSTTTWESLIYSINERIEISFCTFTFHFAPIARPR